MKSMTLAVTALFLALSASAAQAFMHYSCTEQNGGTSQLQIRTFLAEGPANLTVDWNDGGGAQGTDSVHFTGSSIVDSSIGGYPITDGEGNNAVLAITSPSAIHHPCGRGGCDFDGNTDTTASLKYLGKEVHFTCQ